MVADVVHKALDGLAVLTPLQEAADAGLALRERAEGGGIGQERLQELERDDLVSLVQDRVSSIKASSICKRPAVSIIKT